jgi:ABC-type Zn uptake system ZnuABC Zn-binding protein ZnuA
MPIFIGEVDGMKANYVFRITVLICVCSLAACQSSATSGSSSTQAGSASTRNVLAVESFLADIAQNVAGERLAVDPLIPLGLDPHGFEPTPQDVARVAEAQILIVNGAGFEEWLQEILDNAGGERLVIEASAGLAMREPRAGEEVHAGEEEPEHEGDPHFWLDPNQVIGYVANIRDGLSQADPEGAAIYAQNASDYTTKLKELDAWIAGQVEQIPPERRLLVTNHESFGYFADRYGFTIVGTVIASVSTGSAPSAQQIAALIETIKAKHVKAIFLETGANPELAEQIARETGARVISDLFTHSLSTPGGVAATYIDMMKYNTQTIVGALK